MLRLLARQAKINMVVSEAVTGTVTMRLEDVTALQAIAIIVKAKGLFLDQIDNVYYVKTAAERRPSRPRATVISSAIRGQKRLRLCWLLSSRARTRLKLTSARTPFSSAKLAAISTTSANFWSRSTSRPSRS